jgi:cytochrome c
MDRSATIGAWTNYSGALLVTSEGNHTLEYRSTDMAGNAGPINYVNFTIDRVAPVTDLNASGKQGMNEWYVGTVTLNITAADGSSGIRATHYRLDEGDWAISGRDIIISADGNHTLEYYSVDNAGNTENVRSISLKIDTEMPAANFSIDNGTTVDNRSLSVGVTTNDSGSGIALTTYKLDDQVYAPLTGGQINLTGLSEGQHTISLQVMDQAGHSEFKELTFTVDNVTKDVNISSTTTSSDPGPLVILLLVGSAVVAIAAVVGVRLWKRSKR